MTNVAFTGSLQNVQVHIIVLEMERAAWDTVDRSACCATMNSLCLVDSAKHATYQHQHQPVECS